MSQEQVRIGQEQLDNQQRPVLVPVGSPVFKEEHDNWLKWEENKQLLTLRNVGVGTAFNVASVLYGCATYLRDGPTGTQRSRDSANEHWTCWLGVPVAPSEQVNSTYMVGASTFTEGNRQVGGYSFNAPDEEIPGATSPQGVLWHTARVTITYHDIADRKFASIFDYVHGRGWHMEKVLPVDRDLHDLQGAHREAQEAPPVLHVVDGEYGLG